MAMRQASIVLSRVCPFNRRVQMRLLCSDPGMSCKLLGCRPVSGSRLVQQRSTASLVQPVIDDQRLPSFPLQLRSEHMSTHKLEPLGGDFANIGRQVSFPDGRRLSSFFAEDADPEMQRDFGQSLATDVDIHGVILFRGADSSLPPGSAQVEDRSQDFKIQVSLAELLAKTTGGHCENYKVTRGGYVPHPKSPHVLVHPMSNSEQWGFVGVGSVFHQDGLDCMAPVQYLVLRCVASNWGGVTHLIRGWELREALQAQVVKIFEAMNDEIAAAEQLDALWEAWKATSEECESRSMPVVDSERAAKFLRRFWTYKCFSTEPWADPKEAWCTQTGGTRIVHPFLVRSPAGHTVPFFDGSPDVGTRYLLGSSQARPPCGHGAESGLTLNPLSQVENNFFVRHVLDPACADLRSGKVTKLEWEPGDILVINNVDVLHEASPGSRVLPSELAGDPRKMLRVLHRVTPMRALPMVGDNGWLSQLV
eukprot:gnl/TRDRNA2_/TRDRNA2_175840_c0_seq1.p1 gnl/TRDRNA2_/TRDRNA2_175840_c0~~gnl/TRDRNA2_/TRDRNA2_175840_c0_seq1.p1  ORF type:complete len:478 (+),score=52.98 gnl/TRDRNA2_/TRDRNA2_175840_c0_seq1:68-1501(+)